jgi:hypothetical protein
MALEDTTPDVGAWGAAALVGSNWQRRPTNANGHGNTSGESADRVGDLLGSSSSSSRFGQGLERKGGGHAHTLSAPTLPSGTSSAVTSAGSSAGGGGGPLASLPEPPSKSGWLYKRGNLNSSWKRRWFVLKYQTLKYYKYVQNTHNVVAGL